MQPGADARPAATYAAFTDPFESAMLSILLEQEKEILALRKSDVR